VPSTDVRQPAVFIPEGVADYFWHEAEERRSLESALMQLCYRWGYQDVRPPMFEFAEMMEARASRQLQAAMFRFVDRDGSTLTLRPDMTISVARLVGTRLHDQPMPQRFCYAGSVFRHGAPQAGRQREFMQAGIELIGDVTPSADAEVLALTITALEEAGVGRVQVALGQIAFFEGLLRELNLQPEQREMLRHAIDRNSEAELNTFLRDVPLRTQHRRAVEELPRLSGANPTAILDQAERVCLNFAMHEALRNLRAICDMLDVYGLVDRIYLDLTEIRNLGYYTGISFEVLTPGTGFPIASGGRYDSLLGTFGKELPAVGAAVGVDRVLLARDASAGKKRVPHPVTPDVLVVGTPDRATLAAVLTLRRAGLRVVLNAGQTPGQNGGASAPAAICTLRCAEGGFDVLAIGENEMLHAGDFVGADQVDVIEQAVAAARGGEPAHREVAAGEEEAAGERV
jgi:ATP phosphoribosyltransferase regulatory subunit